MIAMSIVDAEYVIWSNLSPAPFQAALHSCEHGKGEKELKVSTRKVHMPDLYVEVLGVRYWTRVVVRLWLTIQ